MKYSLIYDDKWITFEIRKYETYGEALLAMMRERQKVRAWYEHHRSGNIVRFEIREV